MLNTPGSPPGKVSAPSARTRSQGSAGSSAAPPNCFSISSVGNRSIPADTGVWVVNTVPARQATSASEKLSPWLTYSRMRSRPRKPAWPSLVWKTSGRGCPVIAGPAVQPVGDLAQGRVVALHIGIEQQQRHPADLGQPDLRGKQRAVREGNRHLHRRALAIAQQGEGLAIRIARRVALGLPAGRGQ